MAVASKLEPISGATPSSALPETPFAKVNSVVEGSPADIAGLKAGDRIRRFGTANWMNHEKLAKVAEVVQGSEGVSFFLLSSFSLPHCFPCQGSRRKDKDRGYGSANGFKQRSVLVRVIREEPGTDAEEKKELQLQLTPRRDWGGRGLLGCHLLPI